MEGEERKDEEDPDAARLHLAPNWVRVKVAIYDKKGDVIWYIYGFVILFIFFLHMYNIPSLLLSSSSYIWVCIYVLLLAFFLATAAFSNLNRDRTKEARKEAGGEPSLGGGFRGPSDRRSKLGGLIAGQIAKDRLRAAR